jgi:hypothetical protein
MRFARPFPRGLAAIIAPGLALTTGCAPYVTHAPALRHGTQFYATGGFTAIAHSCYPESYPDPFDGTPRTDRSCPEGDAGPAPLYLSVAHTWKPDTLGHGIRLGVDMPPWPGAEALLFAQLSAFWQAPKPRAEAADWGAGAVVSAVWLAPYLQYGRFAGSGRGWYTTQMIGVPHSVLGADEDFGIGWHPAVGVQFPCGPCTRIQEGETLVRLFVQGGIARSPVLFPQYADVRHYWSRMGSIGVSVEARSSLLDVFGR